MIRFELQDLQIAISEWFTVPYNRANLISKCHRFGALVDPTFESSWNVNSIVNLVQIF